MSLRTLKSLREKNPLVSALVLLNLAVGVGWLGVLGSRWFEERRLHAARLEETVSLRRTDGGFTRADALRLHEIALSAVKEKRLDDDEVSFIASRIDAPATEGRASTFTKSPYIRPLLDAKNLTQAQRAMVTPSIIRFLEKEPVGPYDTPAYLAIRALQADKSMSAVQGFKRLYSVALPRRKETFDDAVKREAGVKVIPHQ